MSRPALYRWQPVADDVLWLKYWWGPASANALAFRQADGDWAILSPPKGAPDDVYAAVADRGRVAVLIAPNAYHHLGQEHWRARFPEAVSLAPRDALPRLARKSPGVRYASLEDHAARLAPATFMVPDGMKTPDALFHLPTRDESLWWLGDQFANNGKADQIWLFRQLSRLLAGGPGFACNPKPELVFVADSATWAASIRAALVAYPPTRILCAHGDPVLEHATQRALASLETVAAARR